MLNTKRTMWIELRWEDAVIVERDGDSLRIRHPELKRPRWFNPSQAGNYYSRYTGAGADTFADGYIFKGYPR